MKTDNHISLAKTEVRGYELTRYVARRFDRGKAFVVAGVLLGPEVLDTLSDSVLAQLDPAVSVALAILGVFVGSGSAAALGSINLRWIGGAAAEALVTTACVAGGMYLLLSQWTPILPLWPGTAALVLGTCAAASAALRVDPDASPQMADAAHLADFDDVPLVLAGGSALPRGFRDRFEKALRETDFPISLSEVRVAESPLNATAKGALVAALADGEAA